MLFLQLVANFGWFNSWYKGDISAAFLQGRDRDVKTKGHLYLEPPSRPLEKVPPGALLEVVKSVYGLPDAPRAWWEELTGYLTGTLKFRHSAMDVAFLTWYHDNGNVGIIIVLHVDDVMIAGDGIDQTNKIIDRIYARFPFGEWSKVADHKDGVQYTGRTIQVVRTGNDRTRVIQVHQRDFINGRMDNLTIPKICLLYTSDAADE